MLTECKMVDSFRARNPEAKANYTYWSVRTKARGDNKGLRLCAPDPAPLHPSPLPCCHVSDQLSTNPYPSIPVPCCHVSDKSTGTAWCCRDYWIVSESLLPAAGGAAASGAPTLHDVFHLDQCKAEGMEFCSDHCPIGVTVALP